MRRGRGRAKQIARPAAAAGRPTARVRDRRAPHEQRGGADSPRVAAARTAAARAAVARAAVAQAASHRGSRARAAGKRSSSPGVTAARAAHRENSRDRRALGRVRRHAAWLRERG